MAGFKISLPKPLKLAGFTSNLITFFGFTYFSVGYAAYAVLMSLLWHDQNHVPMHSLLSLFLRMLSHGACRNIPPSRRYL